jgi:hypothetical protein
VRRHPSATKAATRLRDRRADAACNCAKLRAQLRPSVRFQGTADTRRAQPGVRCCLKAATDAPSSLSFRGVTVQEAAPYPESSGRFASLVMPSRIGSATSAPPMRLPHSGMGRAGATTPVSVPPHQAGTIGFDLAVCLRHSEIGLLLADISDPVAVLELDPPSGMPVVEWSPSQERLRGPGLAELVRVVPEARREAVRGSWAATGRPGRTESVAAEGSKAPAENPPFSKIAFRGLRAEIHRDHIWELNTPDLYTIGVLARVFCALSPKSERSLFGSKRFVPVHFGAGASSGALPRRGRQRDLWSCPSMVEVPGLHPAPDQIGLPRGTRRTRSMLWPRRGG